MVFGPIRKGFRGGAVWAAGLACALSLGIAVGGAGQTQQRAKPAPKAVPKPAAKPAPATAPAAAAPLAVVPFKSGEQLNFRALWSKFSVNAAQINLYVLEQRSFFGHAAWHFRAGAHTLETTRLLYPLDDQFDSYTDAAQLTSLQYEMYLHEQGKQQNNVWRMSAQGDPAPAEATAARVAPGTRDPLGALYALRAVDWARTPEFRAPVFDGVHLYDIVARRGEAAGEVTVPAGTFKASRIELHVFEHGQELAGMKFALWLAQDAARTPVLIEVEAPLPIGAARVELTGKQ